MSGDTYLRSIIQKYDVNISGAEAAGNSIYPASQRWGNSYLVKTEFPGSLAKGTGINIGTDADIFISVSSNTPGTLADLYGALFSAVTQTRYTARKQNVSIGATVATTIDWAEGFSSEAFMQNNNALVDLQRLDCGLSVTGGCFDLFGEELKVGPNKNSLAYFIFRLLQKLNSIGTVPAVDWNKYAMVMS